MKALASSGRRVRAGLFEIDLSCGEVHKNGRRLPVQDQPFRVLALLLQHPGEVVTREQLHATLWPADTYVGFDEGLNTAIRKLRLTFGDSADNPRFIETLARRGYRFIAPVSEFADATAEIEQTSTEIPENHPVADVPSDEPQVSALRIASWKLLVSLAASLLLIIVAVVVYLIRQRSSTTAAPVKRVMLAILPFQNLSNDPAQEYFSDGLTEETITDLGQLSPEQLGVIARTSAMTYKHSGKTVSQIGRELGVDYILEGSVRREGGKARVSAQLIRVSDQTHLWAENYDRELNSLLEIEGELGKTIAQHVQVNLTPQGQLALSELHTVDPDAYDLYLRGRYYWNQRTVAGIKESIGYFQQAIAKAPSFALAYSGLADAYNISNIVGAYSPKESLPQARAAAEKAIQLNPALAEAHAALGMENSHYDFDLPGAERELLTAIRLNPNSAYAHLFYSNCYLLPMGRVQEAIAENKKALELDPLSLPINNFMAMTYQFAGDADRAYRQFEHTIAMDPTFPLAHAYFSGLLLEMGRFEQAIQERQKSQLLSGASPEKAAADAAAELKAYKSGGPAGFWRHNLDVFLRQHTRPDGSDWAGGMASAYALVGDKDKAFEWLDKAYEEHEGGEITLLKTEFTWKSLHGDPRFSALLRRMGLPEEEVPVFRKSN